MSSTVAAEPSTFSVSVIIPLFNKSEAIARTLDSLIAQTRAPDELIIVDDGSTDGSAKIARDALADAKFPFRIIEQGNSGVSTARNAGAALARSNYIAFLDADDEWLPGYVAELERLAIAFPEAGVLTIGRYRIDGDGETNVEPNPLPQGYFGVIDNPLAIYPRGRGIICSSTVALRKDCWERSPRFPVNSSCGEDIFLWLNLFLSEMIAHSSTPLALIHGEHSSVGARRGMVGHYFAHFLGTPSGRAALRDEHLTKFLSRNLLAHLIDRKLDRDRFVERELFRLSFRLPVVTILACTAAEVMPRPLLSRLVALQRRRSMPAATRP